MIDQGLLATRRRLEACTVRPTWATTTTLNAPA